MNIKQLKDFIKELPDDMELVVTDSDHHYINAIVYIGEAVGDIKRFMSEYAPGYGGEPFRVLVAH